MKLEIAVPPMPTPNTPSAKPRRAGGYQPETSGTPTANEVPPMPRKKPAATSAGYESCTYASTSTGTTVARLTAGNISRAPKRSVSAPMGMRPTDPTTTGTATRNDWAVKLSPSRSLMPGASGLSSAQAQKQIRKPAVARARLMMARRPGVAVVAGAVASAALGPARLIGPASGRVARHPSPAGARAARGADRGCGRRRTAGSGSRPAR